MLSWTFEEVEQQLIEAMKMLWRLPAGGSSASFAADGPWHLLTRAVRAEAGKMAVMDLWRIEQEEAAKDARAVRTVPLKPEQVTWMNERLGWLELVDDRDRKLVFEAVWQLARGKPRVSWTRIRERMMAHPAWRDTAVTPRRLGQRYSKAIGGIAQSLDARRVAA